jgi:hypothetical protein
MKHSQIFEIPDPELNEKLVPANDNYQLISPTMESLEAQSILAPRDYTGPGRRNRIGLIVTTALCLAALAALVVPLLK